MRRHLAEHLAELVRIIRLGDEDRAGHRIKLADAAVAARGIDHRQLGAEFPRKSRQRRAVDAAGKVDIGQQDVAGGAAGQVPQRVFGVGDRVDLKAMLGKYLRQHIAEQELILDQQNP